jgi:hypothetical protein
MKRLDGPTYSLTHVRKAIDVVVHLVFDLQYPLHSEIGLLADYGEVFFGYEAQRALARKRRSLYQAIS